MRQLGLAHELGCLELNVPQKTWRRMIASSISRTKPFYTA